MASKPAGGSALDALDRVIGLGGSGAGSGEPFIPSKTFQGPKPSYVFRTSEEHGTGYHLDGSTGQQLTNGAAKAASGGGDNGGRETKRARFDSSRDITHPIPARPPKRPLPSGDELLAEAEAAASEQPSKLLDLTPRGIQSASQSLEKTLQRNQLLRAQHPDDPEKFMMNELALHDEIVSFKSAAVDVASYARLAECGMMESFVALLNHENSDVAISVANVLVELLDPALLREGEAADPAARARNMGLLANTFVEGGGMDLLASNLGRFDEAVAEDAQGIEDALTLVESLLDLDRTGLLQSAKEGEKESSSVVACICDETPLVSWLLERIERSDGEDEAAAASAPISPAVLKLHASEVLSAVLQHEDYASRRCGKRLAALPKYASAFDDDADEKPAAKAPEGENGEKKDEALDGIEVLLLAIAAYRKSDPRVEVECELLENVFDALAASLLREDNVVDFVKAEGIELMLRCLRQKVHSGGGALKVLNFALSGSTGTEANDAYVKACETFVQAGGLKILFPLFMARKSAIPVPAACSEGGSDLAKKGKSNNGGTVSKRAKRAAHARKRWLAEVERNSINVMYALTRHIAEDAKHDAHARLLSKFIEEDCEKSDRAIELCLKYDEKARIAEYTYFRSDEGEEAERLGADVELAALDAKLRGGGDAFHRSCAILSFACVGSKRCRGHVLDQLKLQGSGITVIKQGLAEFASLLSDGPQRAQVEQYNKEL
ncbi:hypothetical protein ACHAXT_003849 [Thalassiosira profunda]